MNFSEGALRPKLTPNIASQLADIEPSIHHGVKYYPCSATLKDGTRLDCVYLVAQYDYLKLWGLYPHRETALENIVSVESSSFRLPWKAANKLYDAGESGMGYMIFTVKFSDGSTHAYQSGNAVDFIFYPAGKSVADVAEVEPHVGRDDNPLRNPAFSVCLYCDADTERVFPMGLTRPMEITRSSPWRRLRSRLRRAFSSAVPRRQ